MNRNPICIYHSPCADGFTSAWVVNRYFKGNVDFHPGVYGEPPPDVTGRNVILVDFSYKRPVLEGMAKSANSILILDHHKTAAEDLAGFKEPETYLEMPIRDYWRPDLWHSDEHFPVVRSIFDMDRSGAQITWDFFFQFQSKPRPFLVDYVADRDLWKFEYPSSREVSAYIFAFEYNFANWDLLNTLTETMDGVNRCAELGEAIEQKHRKDIREIIAATKRRMNIAGKDVWVANVFNNMASDAGHIMGIGEPFAATYFDKPDYRIFSLRSAPDGADVSAIAKSFGGGGHVHAAGFHVKLSDLDSLGLR